MELLSMAKHIENEGIQFYSDLADQINTREIRGIFSFLANEERCHYNLFDSWQKNDKTAWLPDDVILENLEKICQKFIHYFKLIKIPAINHDGVYEKAAILEKKSIDFYSEALTQSMNDGLKMLLKRIIKEEETHLALINSLMEFQRHSGEWLENAEWHHKDEY